VGPPEHSPQNELNSACQQCVNQYVSELMDSGRYGDTRYGVALAGVILISNDIPREADADRIFQIRSGAAAAIDSTTPSPHQLYLNPKPESKSPDGYLVHKMRTQSKAGQEVDTTRLGRGRSASALSSLWISDYADTACSTQARAFIRTLIGFLCHYSQRTTLHEVLSKWNKAR
jgi:hypothetical protein